MNLKSRSELTKNDKLLEYFTSRASDGNVGHVKIEILKKQYSTDNLFMERIRYFHSRHLIRNVAPDTLAIDKPGTEFFFSGGFAQEYKDSVSSKIANKAGLIFGIIASISSAYSIYIYWNDSRGVDERIDRIEFEMKKNRRDSI